MFDHLLNNVKLLDDTPLAEACDFIKHDSAIAVICAPYEVTSVQVLRKDGSALPPDLEWCKAHAMIAAHRATLSVSIADGGQRVKERPRELV